MSWIDGFGNMPHDNRHTMVTELAESGAGDEVIMSIAGHRLRNRQLIRENSTHRPTILANGENGASGCAGSAAGGDV